MSIYIDKLILLVIHDKKLLMVRETGQTVPFLLGGKRKEGETDEEVLNREVREEINVDIQSGTIHKFDTFETPAVGKPEGTFVRGTCYFGQILGHPQPSSEIEEIMYVGYDDRPRENAFVHALFLINYIKEK